MPSQLGIAASPPAMRGADLSRDRPDLSCASATLSKSVKAPGESNMVDLKRFGRRLEHARVGSPKFKRRPLPDRANIHVYAGWSGEATRPPKAHPKRMEKRAISHHRFEIVNCRAVGSEIPIYSELLPAPGLGVPSSCLPLFGACKNRRVLLLPSSLGGGPRPNLP